MSPIEQLHIVEAYTFELGKCFEQPIRERMLVNLAKIDAELCAAVAGGLGLPVPDVKPIGEVMSSPALSQVVTEPHPIAGRVIGVVAGPKADLAGIALLRKAVAAHGAVLRVIAPLGGVLGSGRNQEIVERTLLTTRSIEYDAVLIAGGLGGLKDVKLTVLLQEAFRHCKILGAWGDSPVVLTDAGIDLKAPGILVGDKSDTAYAAELVASLGRHRVWERATAVMASA